MEEVVRVLIFEEPITSILAGVILSIAFGGRSRQDLCAKLFADSGRPEVSRQ